MERFPAAPRLNYVRETLVCGVALRPDADWRFYAEVGCAVWVDGGSEPWEFQFGSGLVLVQFACGAFSRFTR